jgi:hypothetical protein
MTRPRTGRDRATPAAARPDAPGTFWGETLPVAPSSGTDFETRVDAAWRHLKAAYFAVYEHDRLREVLASRIEVESMPPTNS